VNRPAALPLVSIGIPTFNRGSQLNRAIASALAQDYPSLELVIADNASTDDTESICMQHASSDSRVKYFRQPSNRGPIQNFSDVLARSSGEAFMWLADDDWLDPSYVRVCVEALRSDAALSLVGGVARYYVGDNVDRVGNIIDLESKSGMWRVLRYYARVADNAIFYGVMWRAQAIQSPMRNVVGADWLFVADMAFRGKIRTLRSIYIHRDSRGISSDIQRRGSVLGLIARENRFPYFSLAKYAFRETKLNSSAYARIKQPGRMLFGCLVAIQILISKSLLQRFRWMLVRLTRLIIGKKNYRRAREKLRRIAQGPL
jgi:glycosyltransferase involved in cell wall biosynthesis